MFRVITMSDRNYFDAGKLFLKTRKKIDASFVLYGPDLDRSQIDILTKHDIEYLKVDPYLFQTQMQFMKFDLIQKEIEKCTDKCQGFSLVDWDTFFINDWKHIYGYAFQLGFTIRPDMIKKKTYRAYTNGGVVFAQYFAYDFLEYIKQVIIRGYDEYLPEYDRIWKTLEKGRPENKTHYRTQLRWWVDQVVSSAISMQYFEKNGLKKMGTEPILYSFKNYAVGLFSCKYYNVLDSNPKIINEKDVFIRHLKSSGRKVLGVEKTKEKL